MAAFHRGLVLVVFSLMLLFFTFFVQGPWYYYGIALVLLFIGIVLVKDGSFSDELEAVNEGTKKHNANKPVYKSSRK